MTRQLPPAWLEDDISQLPALHLLQQLGWTYLTPAEALALRDGREAGVFLTGVLAQWIRDHHELEHRGRRYAVSEANVQSAIQTLTDIPNDTLVRASEAVYHHLRLGKSVDQVLESGAVANAQLHYLDWTGATNTYHVTEEFAVTRGGLAEAYRPDLVLFVNGIPFAVIECKREPSLLDEAVSQQMRNQKRDGIPHLYIPSQLLFALATSEAKYATTGSSRDFWAPWREAESPDDAIASLFTRRPPPAREQAMLAERLPSHGESVARYHHAMTHGREVTEQDRLLWSLARPERLLRMVRRYIAFDAGVKKVARHQQVEAVERAVRRINTKDARGRRQGGVIWHTQGSGKSLTMVYLAAALAEEMR
jgi:type I restriction enzyme R subunit